VTLASKTDVPNDSGAPPKATFLVVLGTVWNLIGSIAAAFAIVAFVGHFVHVGWRGAIGELVSVWDSDIRPAVQFVLDVTVVALLRECGIYIKIPSIIRDYIAVGWTYFVAMIGTDYFINRKYPWQIYKFESMPRPICKIACNIDPLRVDFRVQFRPL
jgi:hypothetical protein